MELMMGSRFSTSSVYVCHFRFDPPMLLPCTLFTMLLPCTLFIVTAASSRNAGLDSIVLLTGLLFSM